MWRIRFSGHLLRWPALTVSPHQYSPPQSFIRITTQLLFIHLKSITWRLHDLDDSINTLLALKISRLPLYQCIPSNSLFQCTRFDELFLFCLLLFFKVSPFLESCLSLTCPVLFAEQLLVQIPIIHLRWLGQSKDLFEWLLGCASL